MRSSWRVPGLSTDTMAFTVIEEIHRGFVRPRRHSEQRVPRQLTEQSCDIELTDVPFLPIFTYLSFHLGHINCIFPFVSHDFVEMLTWTAVNFGGGALRI